MATADVRITVNGQQHEDAVEPRLLLVHYLRDRVGLTDEELARIAAPIGLDLGGLTAEVVAVRNGRSGGRLSASSGRIHEVGT